MRRTRSLVLGVALALVAVQSVSAAPPATRGILPPDARPLGFTLTELAAAWNQWGFGTAEDNPLLAVRCEQSPLDPRIWFLPVSLGGEWENTCNVPPGSFLVLTAGGSECSNLEPEPFFGADEADLLACVNETFEWLTYVEFTFNGKTVTDLADYIVTTPMYTYPPNNLFGADAGISRDKGYFLVLHPLSRGTHTFRAYDEFAIFNFQAGITYTINVGG